MADTKGDRTRQRIVSTTAPLFNQLGYAATSVAHLMEATGLEKGGIYRHFASKDAIAIAAFDHAVRLQGDRFRALVAAAGPDPVSRMTAIAEGIAATADNPTVAGGCPLMNTAIECDDADGELARALRSRARRAMSQLIGAVRRIIDDGIAAGQLASSVDADAEASVFVATMEGALMLSRLYKDTAYVRRAVDRVRERGEQLRAPSRTRAV